MTFPLKKTALYDWHVAAGAKMVPFAGFEMPVRYTSDKDEHLAVRQSVGIFDVSHMGEFMVRGPQALALIQKVISNDAAKLQDGKALYAYLPNERGGIVDDLLVYRLAAQEYMLVVNASNIQKDWDWLQSHNTMGAEMEDISEQTSLFAVQGPKATEALQALTDTDLGAMKYYTFTKGTLAGIPNVLISATGYTGAGGFELYLPNTDALRVWEAILEAGRSVGIVPVGLGARDTLRTEKGYCLYGNDIHDDTCPLEAGLGWVTKFNKDFINAEALRQKMEQGLSRRLVAFKMVDKGIPRGHYPIVDAQGQVIGEVSSGTLSPSLNIGIGLGYVPQAYAQPGSEIFVQIRQKNLKAEVAKLPLV
ncbi:MAG: glycine cleavage system aminomethyltransferase GcvT [Microscillaceae bacterium]